MRKTRTQNTKRNIITSYGMMLMQMIFQFVSRSVIVNALGEQYLGLSSLFSSILTVLSMAELGFSTAIIYNLYKPLANNDTEQVCALLAYYKKVYRIVGIVMLSLGLAAMPFLRIIIKGDVPADINMYVLYLLYLTNTSASYFLFAHKTALLTAVQRLDLTKIVSMLVLLTQYVLQIVVLIWAKNYYLYVGLLILGSVTINMLNALVARKQFPEYECRGEIDKRTKKDIITRVKGLLVCKISGVTYTSLDSIIISSFIGLSSVAIYNNYITIFSAVTSVVLIIRSSMQASVGDSIACESVEKNYQDLLLWQFLFSVIATWCMTCMVCLYQPFMTLWMGENMLLPMHNVILISFWFMVSVVQQAYYLYLSGNGLWSEMKWSYVFSTVFNLTMNIVLGKVWGITGIILSSVLSNIICGSIWQCKIIFKSFFNRSPKEYFAKQVSYFIVAFLASAVTYSICSLVSKIGLIGLILRMFICAIVPPVLLYIFYRKTELFIKSIVFVQRIIRR